MDLEELYDNLSVEISNLGIRLDKNVYEGESKKELENFLKDFNNLCKSERFNILFIDLENLKTYQELLSNTDMRSVEYVASSIKSFYTEFIESIKDESY